MWEVEVVNRVKLPFTTFEVERFGLRVNIRVGPNSPTLIGIDPGQVNMGIAILSDGLQVSYQIKLPSTVDTVERIVQTIEITERLLVGYDSRNSLAVVEGAAYAAMYGQVALAENRTAAIIGLLKAGVHQVLVVPPGTIRKEVFGTSKQRAEDTWPQVGKDAASALCCALHAHQIKEKTDAG